MSAAAHEMRPPLDERVANHPGDPTLSALADTNGSICPPWRTTWEVTMPTTDRCARIDDGADVLRSRWPPRRSDTAAFDRHGGHKCEVWPPLRSKMSFVGRHCGQCLRGTTHRRPRFRRPPTLHVFGGRGHHFDAERLETVFDGRCILTGRL